MATSKEIQGPRHFVFGLLFGAMIVGAIWLNVEVENYLERPAPQSEEK